MVPELTPVRGIQPAGDVSHEPGGRLTAIPAVTFATLKRSATNFAAWLNSVFFWRPAIDIYYVHICVFTGK